MTRSWSACRWRPSEPATRRPNPRATGRQRQTTHPPIWLTPARPSKLAETGIREPAGAQGACHARHAGGDDYRGRGHLSAHAGFRVSSAGARPCVTSRRTASRPCDHRLPQPAPSSPNRVASRPPANRTRSATAPSGAVHFPALSREPSIVTRTRDILCAR